MVTCHLDYGIASIHYMKVRTAILLKTTMKYELMWFEMKQS